MGEECFSSDWTHDLQGPSGGEGVTSQPSTDGVWEGTCVVTPPHTHTFSYQEMSLNNQLYKTAAPLTGAPLPGVLRSCLALR